MDIDLQLLAWHTDTQHDRKCERTHHHGIRLLLSDSRATVRKYHVDQSGFISHVRLAHCLDRVLSGRVTVHYELLIVN